MELQKELHRSHPDSITQVCLKNRDRIIPPKNGHSLSFNKENDDKPIDLTCPFARQTHRIGNKSAHAPDQWKMTK